MATPAEQLPSVAPDLMDNDYLSHREDLANRTAGQQLLAQVSNAQATQPQAPEAAQPENGNIVGRVAKDIGKGVFVESPLAVLHGVRDAFANLFKMGDELTGWLEQKSADTPLKFMNAGIYFDDKGVHWMSPEEAKSQKPFQVDTLIPDVKDQTTVTGNLIKGTAQFLTGFKGAGNLIKGAGLAEAGGAAGYGVKSLHGAAAAFTAFDPQQKRLSDLIQQFPALQNPVTAYLASDPTDNAAEGRFKNALEGVGMGLLTDGFFKGVKLLKQAAAGKAAAADAARIVTEPPTLADDAFKPLGSEKSNAALVATRKINPEDVLNTDGVEQIASSAAGRASNPSKTFINYARIDTPEDVQKVMGRLADMAAPAPDSARAGARTFEAMKLDAAHQNAWDVLMSRRAGQPLSDAESVAARELWAATTDKVAELAQAAADTPSEANLFAFRKMLSVHDMVQNQVLGARASAARSVASWRIPVGSPAERLRDVTDSLNASGGSDVARELAMRVSALARAGMVQEMTAVTQKGAYATTRDAVVEAWINGLLSNPTTHAANTISNSSVVFVRMAERGIASKISATLGSQDGVAAGEASAQFFGLRQGLKDAFRYAYKSMKTGESGYGINKIETAREGSITSDAFKLSSDSGLGRGVDLLGGLVRTPGRALTAEDEFFKTIGYRMELNAQALRQATSELPEGSTQAIKQRIAEIVANPPQNIRMAAIDSATYQTFTNAPGKLAQSLGRLTSTYPALKVILPFTRTPANILSFTFERTPLSPLLSKFRADVAAGGARRDLALAQTLLGSAAMATFADLTLDGKVSGRGPAERGQREALMREGWKPYSLKLGDRWYSYNRLDPVGSLVGMSSDFTEMLQQAQHSTLEDADTEKVAVASALAFAGNITNKTYLSGLSSVIDALNDPQQSAEGWAQRLAASVIPAGVGQAARTMDPTVRQVYSMMDAIQAKVPGLSKDLPPRLDMWGEPLTNESGIGKPFDAFSPVYSMKPTPEPIDQEILRNDINLTIPGKKVSFDGASVDMGQFPHAYARYVQLAGNELKHPAWGMGAKDLLNAIVTGKHPLSEVYKLKSDGPEGGKDLFIRGIVNDYRKMARAQILQEYPDIREQVDAKKAAQRELRMPVQ